MCLRYCGSPPSEDFQTCYITANLKCLWLACNLTPNAMSLADGAKQGTEPGIFSLLCHGDGN